MSIQDITAKFKGFLARDDVFMAALVILVAAASFGLGRASMVNLGSGEAAALRPQEGQVVQQEGVSTKPSVGSQSLSMTPSKVEQESMTEVTVSAQGSYVGSKNGSKYHLPWCSGAKRIKEENRIWFQSKEEAESAGYTPAANCKGI